MEKVLSRYFATASLSDTRYLNDFRTVADEVVRHLAVPGTTLRIRVEIEAERPSGFSDQTVRAVRENAAVLRFEQSEFEQD